jgi:RNA polymerase sigma-70 factor (ECF subfamily)
VSIAVTTPAEPTPTETRRARFNALFDAHAAAVFGFALRRTSRSEAEDVVSETFLVAWRRLDAVPETPLPWLIGVARRVLGNRRRSDARQSELRTRLETDTSATAVPSSDVASEASVVRAAVDSLSVAERDAITLLAWDGLSADEAAAVLGCTRAAFYVRVHRARRKLAARLGPNAEATLTTEIGSP